VEICKEGVRSLFQDMLHMRWEMDQRSGFDVIL
jgi:hypothetical protein